MLGLIVLVERLIQIIPSTPIPEIQLKEIGTHVISDEFIPMTRHNVYEDMEWDDVGYGVEILDSFDILNYDQYQSIETNISMHMYFRGRYESIWNGEGMILTGFGPLYDAKHIVTVDPNNPNIAHFVGHFKLFLARTEELVEGKDYYFSPVVTTEFFFDTKDGRSGKFYRDNDYDYYGHDKIITFHNTYV